MDWIGVDRSGSDLDLGGFGWIWVDLGGFGVVWGGLERSAVQSECRSLVSNRIGSPLNATGSR